MSDKTNPEILFWSHVDKTSSPDGCWLWTAYKKHNGHGRFMTNKKSIGAHRFSWILLHGNIPENQCVLHSCKNLSCVNPNHLFLETKSKSVAYREPKPLERILSKIDKTSNTNGCWEWTGYFSNNRTVMKIYKKHVSIRRFIYEYYINKIPKNHAILSKCKNTKCVNPNHLLCVPNSQKKIFSLKDPFSLFWKKVDKTSHPNNCWIWIAAKDGRGYGFFTYHGKQIRSHRVSWIFKYGDIPDNLHVLHHCDNPSCVNPDHLFLGTRKDNMQDMIRKKRNNPCPGDKNGLRKHPESIIRGNNHWCRKMPEKIVRGERIGNSKLTEKQVMEIRQKYIPRKVSSISLAKLYNISYRTVIDIIHRKIWTHI